MIEAARAHFFGARAVVVAASPGNLPRAHDDAAQQRATTVLASIAVNGGGGTESW